jgi:hypothetical protein
MSTWMKLMHHEQKREKLENEELEGRDEINLIEIYFNS